MPARSAVLNRIPDEAPWYKHRWPWLLMLGPFTVVIAGIFTIWIAVTQQDALVVDDYYKQGKAINQDLRRDRVASNLGMHFSAYYDTDQQKLIGNVSSDARQAIGDISLRLIHATLPEKDISLSAKADAGGRFEISLPELTSGRWQVWIENRQRDWRLGGVWLWPAQKNLILDADLNTQN
ncbi:Uncharacterized conserved protein [Janthinobacterium sp. Marseille]|nr:FixH family protein [Janthinobacterium sp. Marseille]ABR90298.1 Uncharacterized conserved protein [Janthinobacterium sp. Marseille]